MKVCSLYCSNTCSAIVHMTVGIVQQLLLAQKIGNARFTFNMRYSSDFIIVACCLSYRLKIPRLFYQSVIYCLPTSLSLFNFGWNFLQWFRSMIYFNLNELERCFQISVHCTQQRFIISANSSTGIRQIEHAFEIWQQWHNERTNEQTIEKKKPEHTSKRTHREDRRRARWKSKNTKKWQSSNDNPLFNTSTIYHSLMMCINVFNGKCTLKSVET